MIKACFNGNESKAEITLSEDDTGLSIQHQRAIQKCLAGQPKVEQAILYGSRAMGTFRAGSDIDLALKGELSLAELNTLVMAIDDLLLPYELDLSLFELINNLQLCEHIERVGKVFYQRLP